MCNHYLWFLSVLKVSPSLVHNSDGSSVHIYVISVLHRGCVSHSVNTSNTMQYPGSTQHSYPLIAAAETGSDYTVSITVFHKIIISYTITWGVQI
jgi:hypothetical protein